VFAARQKNSLLKEPHYSCAPRSRGNAYVIPEEHAIIQEEEAGRKVCRGRQQWLPQMPAIIRFHSDDSSNPLQLQE